MFRIQIEVLELYAWFHAFFKSCSYSALSFIAFWILLFIKNGGYVLFFFLDCFQGKAINIVVIFTHMKRLFTIFHWDSLSFGVLLRPLHSELHWTRNGKYLFQIFWNSISLAWKYFRRRSWPAVIYAQNCLLLSIIWYFFGQNHHQPQSVEYARKWNVILLF